MNDVVNARDSHSVLHSYWIAGEATRHYALNGRVDAYIRAQARKADIL